MVTLKQQLYEYLQGKDWVHGGDLERFGMSLGYMSENVLRRMRELRKDGLVESEKRKPTGSKVATCWWHIKRTALNFNYRPEVLKVKANQKLF